MPPVKFGHLFDQRQIEANSFALSVKFVLHLSFGTPRRVIERRACRDQMTGVTLNRSIRKSMNTRTLADR